MSPLFLRQPFRSRKRTFLVNRSSICGRSAHEPFLNLRAVLPFDHTALPIWSVPTLCNGVVSAKRDNRTLARLLVPNRIASDVRFQCLGHGRGLLPVAGCATFESPNNWLWADMFISKSAPLVTPTLSPSLSSTHPF